MLDIPGLPGIPVPTPRVLYVLHESGALGQITVNGDLEPILADGARLLTQAVYEQMRAQMQEDREARLAALQAADEKQQVTAYRDLRAAGIPEATARALSRYEGPELTDVAQAGEG